ncbi:MAG: undecaprenyldiphospho-muramoylpentapeptide beta-N-acetylglucosaminyltransferase [Bacteroidota bacterium]
MGNYRFILSGGGTGGHIYPAIAIANALKRRYTAAEILFVGARDKMEMDKVPQAGFKIKGLWISGLHRKLTVKNLMFPLKLIHSLWNARKIVKQFRPHVVVGTGGFASGPLLRIASGKGIPCLLQEQNSYAGITNKLLAKKARTICVAYDGMERYFPKDKLVKTGNPVRSDLIHAQVDKPTALNFFGLNRDKPVVLILGGSLGARRINQLIEAELSFFKGLNLQLLWQCGKLYEEEYSKYEAEDIKVKAFINSMENAFAVADIIISRSGAGTVSELCLVGKPVLFIPSPNVAEDHQTKNAMALVQKNAALVYRESQSKTEFEVLVKELTESKKLQSELGANIKKLALPEATEHIVNEIEKLLP